MRAREFVSEAKEARLQDAVSKALPATYSIPALQNQDPYLQYRFGVALAQTKGRLGSEQSGEDIRHSMTPRSAWGENQVIVSYDPNIDDWIDAALKEVGLSPRDKQRISTPASEESSDTGSISPVKPFKGYAR